MLESLHADRNDRPTLDPHPPPALRRDRAGGRPAGPRAAGRRPRRPALRHRRLDLSGPPPVGPAGGRGHPDRHGRPRDPPRHPRLRGGPPLRRGPRPHHDGTVPLRAVPGSAGGHHHPRPVQRGADRHLPGQRRPGPDRGHLPRPASGRARDPDRPGHPPRRRRLASFRWATAPATRTGPTSCSSAGWPRTRVPTGPSRSPARPASGSLLAAKMREPWEMHYFSEQVEPLLGNDARYLGEVSHERKLELLAGASALLFPIRWNEPFGMVMIEAMACGTPVLAFPEGAAPEVVDDGRTGFLCDDEAAMVEAIGRLGELKRKRLPAGGGGLLLHQPDGGRAHRALRVDDELSAPLTRSPACRVRDSRAGAQERRRNTSLTTRTMRATTTTSLTKIQMHAGDEAQHREGTNDAMSPPPTMSTPSNRLRPLRSSPPVLDALSLGHVPRVIDAGRSLSPASAQVADRTAGHRPVGRGPGGTVRRCPCGPDAQALIERDDLRGDAFCRAYAEAADQWLTSLFDQATGGDARGMALVAVGGLRAGRALPVQRPRRRPHPPGQGEHLGHRRQDLVPGVGRGDPPRPQRPATRRGPGHGGRGPAGGPRPARRPGGLRRSQGGRAGARRRPRAVGQAEAAVARGAGRPGRRAPPHLRRRRASCSSPISRSPTAGSGTSPPSRP